MSTFRGLATVIIGDRAIPDVAWIGSASSDAGVNLGRSAPVVLIIEAMDDAKVVELTDLDTSVPGNWTGRTWPDEQPVVVRPTLESDAIISTTMSGMPSVPMPLDVIGSIHASNGVFTMPTLWAMTDDDGFVVTMMLNSDTGLYVRFASAWHRLVDDDVVDGLSVVEVDDSSLEMFDQFDRAGQLVHVSAMSQGGMPIPDEVLQEPDPDAPVAVVSAAQLKEMPALASADDLPLAIAQAQADPELQWWVERRVKALGLSASLPWAK